MLTCERIDPEVGHEEEGYSCWVHNHAWDECPHRISPESETGEHR